ncbi:MAG: tetratricopeptide repeat protein, partial [Gemmataceae bacterium]|nr:tetratricopeptide repeat protein [Gemmataceae bacterium]
RLVRGELDWIVMKALEKDRNRRYETANGFAMDVQRYLADEPVLACPPSMGYRLRKFARRNKAALLTATLLTGALVLSVVVLAISNRWVVAERDEKTEALQGKVSALATAEANYNEAKKQETLANNNAKEAESQRLRALAETYRAMLSETEALRLAGKPGWRAQALHNLARLVQTDISRRDVGELRSEAVACLGEFDVRETAQFTAHGGHVWAVEFSPDGKHLVSIDEAANVYLWDVAQGRFLRQVNDPQEEQLNANPPKRSVSFGPDGTNLAYSSGRFKVILAPLQGDKVAARKFRSTGLPASLAFDRRGGLLAVGSGIDWGQKAQCTVYDSATGAVKRVIECASSPMCPVAFSPDGSLLAVTGPGHTVQVYRMGNYKEPVTLGHHHQNGIRSLTFSPDGRYLASVSADRTVKLWDVTAGQEYMTLHGHTDQVNCAAFSPDGALLATASDDQTVRLLEARTGRLVTVLKPWSSSVISLAFSPDGSQLAIGGGTDSPTTGTIIKVYELTSRQERRQLAGLGWGRAAGLAFHPRKPRLTARGIGLNTWDIPSGRLLLANYEDKGGWGPIAYSPNGELLVGADDIRYWGNDTSIRIWDAETGKLRRRLVGHGKRNIRCLAFDVAGKRFASGADDGTAVVWDPLSGDVLRRWEGFKGPVQSIAFVHGDSRLVLADSTGLVVLGDAATGGRIRQRSIAGGLGRFAVTPDERRLVIGGADGALRILTVPDLELGQAVEKAHEGEIQAIALSPNGRWLASGGADRRVVLWDAGTLQRLFTFPPHNAPILNVAFDPGGDYLAIGEAQRDVTLWNLTLVRPQLVGIGLDWEQRRTKAAVDPLSPSAPATQAKIVQLPEDAWEYWYQRGRSLMRTAGSKEAIPCYSKAIELGGDAPGLWYCRGRAYAALGQWDRAVSDYTKALALRPDYADAYRLRARSLEALKAWDRALDDLSRLIKLEPDDAGAYVALGDALLRQKKPDEAINAYRQALKALGPDHPEAANIQSQLASVYQSRGNLPEAIRLLEQIRDQRRAKFGPNHAATLASMNNLAVVYWRNKQLDRAIPLMEETVRLKRANPSLDDAETRTSIGNLGVMYREAGRLREATPLLEEVVEWLRKQPAPVASRFAWVTGALVGTYEQAQQFAKAEPFHREAVQRAQQRFGSADPRRAGPLAVLGLNLLRQRKYAAAAPLLRDCLALREKTEPDGWTTFNTKSMLGGCLLGEKKYADAEPLLLQGYEGMKQREARIPPLARPRLAEAIERLVQLYHEWGKPEKSAEWRKKLDAK